MHARPRTSEREQRRGYILLLVLVTLVISSVALSSLARVSLRRGLDALQAQDELQRRWGVISCQRTLLPAAARLFQEREESQGTRPSVPLPPVIQETLLLGGQRIELLLADEDAKVNLNSLYNAAGQSETESGLMRLLGTNGVHAVALSPEVPSQAASRRSVSLLDAGQPEEDDMAIRPAFCSWGEVFDLRRLRERLGDARLIAGLTREVTCWGNGRLNLRRASDDAVLTICRPIVADGLARRLLQRYRENPHLELGLLIEKEVNSPEEQAQMLELLGESSSSFSLWTEVTSTRFRQQRFAVRQTDAEGRVRTTEFDW